MTWHTPSRSEKALRRERNAHAHDTFHHVSKEWLNRTTREFCGKHRRKTPHVQGKCSWCP